MHLGAMGNFHDESSSGKENIGATKREASFQNN
jgi:hypothetical protein